MNDYSTRSYQLSSTGSGKIAAALAKMCAQGEIGESLFRSGITQASFCLFLVKLAREHIVTKAKEDEAVSRVFLLVSGGNASAAQKALASCSIKWEAVDEKGESILDNDGNPTWEKIQQSVEAYWKKIGSGSREVNLSDLD